MIEDKSIQNDNPKPQPARTTKAIYKHEDGQFYVHDFSDKSETLLCNNSQYAKKYGELYGIQVRF